MKRMSRLSVCLASTSETSPQTYRKTEAQLLNTEAQLLSYRFA